MRGKFERIERIYFSENSGLRSYCPNLYTVRQTKIKEIREKYAKMPEDNSYFCVKLLMNRYFLFKARHVPTLITIIGSKQP